MSGATSRAEAPSVLFLVRSMGRGGAERQLVTLATGLHARGWRVAVAVFYGTGDLLDELHAARIPVHDLGKRGRWDAAGMLLRLRRLVRAERPAVLHSYLETANVCAGVLKPFLGATRVVWGVRSSSVAPGGYDRLTRALSRAAAVLGRTADLIVVNSRAGAAHAISAGYPEGRIRVVPNGFDTARFAPDPAGGARLRGEWGVAPAEVLVGLVARVDPIKDHPTFLEAAARLARARPELRFVCVGGGDGARAAELRSRAAALGLDDRLRWAGERSDLAAVYTALDVACLASRAEGFPNTVGEAMSCGTPCAVTDVGDARWLVGDTGEVVPPGDPDALAAGILALLARRREDPGLGASARRRIVENFGTEALVTTTARLLQGA